MTGILEKWGYILLNPDPIRLMMFIPYHMGVCKNGGGPPKSSILIGFFIIFTIHFGGPPLFLEAPIWELMGVHRPDMTG